MPICRSVSDETEGRYYVMPYARGYLDGLRSVAGELARAPVTADTLKSLSARPIVCEHCSRPIAHEHPPVGYAYSSFCADCQKHFEG